MSDLSLQSSSLNNSEISNTSGAPVVSDPISEIATALTTRIHRDFCALAYDEMSELHGIIQEELLPYEDHLRHHSALTAVFEAGKALSALCDTFNINVSEFDRARLEAAWINMDAALNSVSEDRS